MNVSVSIVIAAYNVAEFLPAALERLQQQTHRLLQIVVVDDASTDDSAAIAERFSRDDPRVLVVRQPQNTGVAQARRAGFEASDGAYVWFVDADDEWPADAVATLADAAELSGAEVVCARAEVVRPDGSTGPVGRLPAPTTMSATTAFRCFLRGEISGHLWNKLFARSVLEPIDFTRSWHHSDQAMVAQALAAAASVVTIDAPVYRYLLRQGSIIRSGKPRDASLRTVGGVVTRTATALDPALPASRDFRYYRARFLLLSRLKDATSAAHDGPQAKALLRQVRSEIGVGDLAALGATGDLKRLLLLASAKTSNALYQRIMRLPGARV